jgi:hypothetical protein
MSLTDGRLSDSSGRYAGDRDMLHIPRWRSVVWKVPDGLISHHGLRGYGSGGCGRRKMVMGPTRFRAGVKTGCRSFLANRGRHTARGYSFSGL